MKQKIEFFYDYVSPYSYLANSQLADLQAEIVYRPILLGALMKSVGNQPPATLAPRGDYMFKDIARWARHYQTPFSMNPAFPMSTVKALRVALVAQQDETFERVHQSLFEAVWAQQLDVSNEEVLSTMLERSGFDADSLLQRASDDNIKAKLRQNTDEALERGAFGAPTFFVGDKMFFGNDRLHFVQAALVDQ